MTYLLISRLWQQYCVNIKRLFVLGLLCNTQLFQQQLGFSFYLIISWFLTHEYLLPAQNTYF